MNTHRARVLIIGAGIGGLAAAARLARMGFAVQVLEKNPEPGGRCGRLIREGHRFDTGPTLLLMPEVFTQTYADLGERIEDHLDLIRAEPLYQIFFPDGSRLTMTGDLVALREQLDALASGSFEGFVRYLADGHRFYRIAMERFIGRNFPSFFSYFSPAHLRLLLDLRALAPHYQETGRYVRDPRLRMAMTFQDMYLGLSPYEAPATYAMLAAAELIRGIWFPRGGMYRLVESLERIARGYGAQFVYQAPVQRIETDGDRATAVILENGERVEADFIIVNADLPYAYRHLLPPSPEARRMERYRYTCSAITFYWGLRAPAPQLSAHNLFFAGDYRASFERIFRDHDMPDAPSFYIHAPARLDPSAAPPGRDTLMALVPVGHLSPKQPDIETMIHRARGEVERRLKEELGIPVGELRHFEVVYTPETWKRLYNLEKGAAFGLSHHFQQMGYLRPSNRHPRYRNLYFVGASTHPGTGLPMVLISARLAVERLIEEHPIALRRSWPVPRQASASP